MSKRDELNENIEILLKLVLLFLFCHDIFWVKAFMFVVSIINLLPTDILNGSSPCTMLFLKSINYYWFKVFGVSVIIG